MPKRQLKDETKLTSRLALLRLFTLVEIICPDPKDGKAWIADHVNVKIPTVGRWWRCAYGIEDNPKEIQHALGENLEAVKTAGDLLVDDIQGRLAGKASMGMASTKPIESIEVVCVKALLAAIEKPEELKEILTAVAKRI